MYSVMGILFFLGFIFLAKSHLVNCCNAKKTVAERNEEIKQRNKKEIAWVQRFIQLHEVFLFGTVFLWERFSISQKFCFGTFFEWYKFSFGTFSESMIGWKWNDSHTLWVTRFSSNHWLGKCAKIKFGTFKKCAKTKFLRKWKSLSQENCAKKKYPVYIICLWKMKRAEWTTEVGVFNMMTKIKIYSQFLFFSSWLIDLASMMASWISKLVTIINILAH